MLDVIGSKLNAQKADRASVDVKLLGLRPLRTS